MVTKNLILSVKTTFRHQIYLHMRSRSTLYVFLSTGSTELDQVLIVLLSTAMFVGGLLGFILDNTVPGKNTCFALNTYIIDLAVRFFNLTFRCSSDLTYPTDLRTTLICIHCHSSGQFPTMHYFKRDDSD